MPVPYRGGVMNYRAPRYNTGTGQYEEEDDPPAIVPPGSTGVGMAVPPELYANQQQGASTGGLGMTPLPAMADAASVGAPAELLGSMTTPWGGWNEGNIFDYEAINERAKTGEFGISRDEIANQRDAYIQGKERQWHDALRAAGKKAEGGTANLFADPNFQHFIRTGEVRGEAIQNAPPADQWNAQGGGGTTGVGVAAPPPIVETYGDGAGAGAAGTQDDFLRLLMERIQKPVTVNRDDATVRAQVDPYVAQQTRASREYLANLAEQRGGAPVNLRGEQRLAAEHAGQASGLFESELLGREIGARRNEVAQALSLYGNQLNERDRATLQRELAALDRQQREADRQQQREQFEKELALREWDIGEGYDARWAGF